MRIHLLHGIHTGEDDTTVAQLIPYLEQGTGLEVIYHRYGYAHALTSRFLNGSRASKIALHVKRGDICVGHSNGCCLIWLMATKYAAPVGGAVFINPALDADAEFPPAMKFVHVYYNKGDGAVPWSKYLWSHPWGPMGRDGYAGPDERVKNIDTAHWDHKIPVFGHSAIFRPEALQYWGRLIAKNLLAAGVKRRRGWPADRA